MTDRELMDRIRGLYEVKEPDVLPRLKFSEVEMVTAEPVKPHKRYVGAAAIYAAACLVLVIALPFIIGRGEEPEPAPGVVPSGTPAVETSATEAAESAESADDPIRDEETVEFTPPAQIPEIYRELVESAEEDYRASGKWDGDDSFLDPEQIKDFDLAEYQSGQKKKGEYYRAVAEHFMETVREKYPESMELWFPDFGDLYLTDIRYSSRMLPYTVTYFVLEPDKLDDSREGYAKMYLSAYIIEDMYAGQDDPVKILESFKYSGDPARHDIGDIVGVTLGGTFYWHNIGEEAWATAELCDNMDEIRAAYDEISVKVKYEYYEEYLGKDSADKLVPEYEPEPEPELTVKEKVMAAMERAIDEGRVEDKDYDWDEYHRGAVQYPGSEVTKCDDDLFTFSLGGHNNSFVYCDGEVYHFDFSGAVYSVYKIQYCDIDKNGVKDMLFYGWWGSGVDGRALSYFDSNTKTVTHLYNGVWRNVDVKESDGEYEVYARYVFGGESYIGALEYENGEITPKLIYPGTMENVVRRACSEEKIEDAVIYSDYAVLPLCDVVTGLGFELNWKSDDIVTFTCNRTLYEICISEKSMYYVADGENLLVPVAGNDSFYCEADGSDLMVDSETILTTFNSYMGCDIDIFIENELGYVTVMN